MIFLWIHAHNFSLVYRELEKRGRGRDAKMRTWPGSKRESICSRCARMTYIREALLSSIALPHPPLPVLLLAHFACSLARWRSNVSLYYSNMNAARLSPNVQPKVSTAGAYLFHGLIYLPLSDDLRRLLRMFPTP